MRRVKILAVSSFFKVYALPRPEAGPGPARLRATALTGPPFLLARVARRPRAQLRNQSYVHEKSPATGASV